MKTMQPIYYYKILENIESEEVEINEDKSQILASAKGLLNAMDQALSSQDMNKLQGIRNSFEDLIDAIRQLPSAQPTPTQGF